MFDASSSYDYGYKAGKLLKLQYRLIDLIARFTKINNINKQKIEEQIQFLKQHYTFFLDELRGLSASTNIKLERLLYLKDFLRSLGGSCTTMLATGPATKNNETFLIDNLDCNISSVKSIIGAFIINRLFISRKFWIKDISYSELYYKYLYRGFPILMEFPIMNEKGLSFGGTGIIATKNKSRYIDTGPGIDIDMLRALAMSTCKNVSEVASLYKSIERMSDVYHGTHLNDALAWCDREGGILMIEDTHNYIITVFGNSTEITGVREGILWHANIHQWLDPNLTGSALPSEHPSSGLRAERAQELLEANYGNITLDVCKKMAGDHGGGFDPDGKDSGDLCRHPDENQIIVTSYSFIINPKDFTIYVSHRSPCKGIFWRYDLSKKFEK